MGLLYLLYIVIVPSFNLECESANKLLFDANLHRSSTLFRIFTALPYQLKAYKTQESSNRTYLFDIWPACVNQWG